MMPPRDPPSSWNFATAAGLASLILLWAWQLHSTWGAWGDLTVDSGHEMYVPALLAEGKTLYRDVWFLYGPASPYANSYLFRAFGVHLNVLYWAGSLSALGSAVVLYLIGMRLSAWMAGWAAGAVQIAEAFRRSLFCFPLPYSFAAVYGCLTACLFLWVVIIASTSTHRVWLFTAGVLAAIAALLKPEFGMAAYGTLFLVIAVRGIRKPIAFISRDVAAVAPGVALCVAVVFWMVSLRGAAFITQENLVNWPTSYFMRTYGRFWLEQNGFTLSAAAIQGAAIRAVLPAGVLLETYCLLRLSRARTPQWLLTAVAIPGLLTYYVLARGLGLGGVVVALIFPTDMVLYVAIAALIGWFSFSRQPPDARNPAVPILLSFAGLLAFRILMRMSPTGYSIFYNGPVLLGYLMVVRSLLLRSVTSPPRLLLGDALISVLPAVLIVSAIGHFRPDTTLVPLTTPRGTVRVPKQLAENYTAAIAFMKDKAAAGESVLSVPEDTSLYFLSETYCPIRMIMFVPGIIAPGKMTDDTIQEIERKRVRYLLWSNRTFEEFGAPVFGTDFDTEIGDYFRSHYQRLGPVTPMDGWRADVWERKGEVAFR